MNPSMITAKGSVKKQVTCESCHHQYEYEMKRTAYGSFSGFAMTRAEADEKAALDAADKLKEMLRSECNSVPCPKCGALTRQMKESEAQIVPVCLGGLAIGGLVMGGVYFVGTSTGRWFFVVGIIGICCFAFSGIILLAKFFESIINLGRMIKNLGKKK